MVGDMMEQDVAFGSRCGFQRLLVLSGGASREDMMKEADGACVPDYYADSLADFGKLTDCKLCTHPLPVRIRSGSSAIVTAVTETNGENSNSWQSYVWFRFYQQLHLVTNCLPNLQGLYIHQYECFQ